MKKLLPLIFVTLLLAGCASQGSTEMTDDPLLQHQQECASYKGDIQKAVNLEYNSKKESVAFPGTFSISTGTLDEIFYSPQRDSCMYVVGRESSYKIVSGEHYGNDYKFYAKVIEDFNTKKAPFMTMIYCKDGIADCSDLSSTGTLGNSYIKNIKDFNQKIQELKGE